MQFPSGRYYENGAGEYAEYSDANSIEAPLWLNPDGSLKKGSCWSRFRYAPYGINMMPTYAREIIGNSLKEFVAIILICIFTVGVAASPIGADPVSRAIFVGLVAALSYYAVLNWGYNDRLPRFLTPGAVIVELFDGSINWLLAIIFLAVGFIAAIVAAGIMYSTGSSAIPIIGTPNATDIAGVFFVQLLLTGVIALTAMDQFTTKRGKPRTFKNHNPTSNLVEDNDQFPNDNRKYREDLGARPYVYAAAIWLIVSFSYLKYGLFTFNAYIYMAGALGSQFLGASNAFNNVGLGGVGNYVGGAGALFMLTDILAWVLAWGLNMLLYYLHNNEPRDEFDDSSYGGVATVKQNQRSGRTATRNNAGVKAMASQPRRVQSSVVTQRRPIETRADFVQDLASPYHVESAVPQSTSNVTTMTTPGQSSMSKFNASAWTGGMAHK